jgi:hypothetical protein
VARVARQDGGRRPGRNEEEEALDGEAGEESSSAAEGHLPGDEDLAGDRSGGVGPDGDADNDDGDGAGSVAGDMEGGGPGRGEPERDGGVSTQFDLLG